MVSSQNQVLLGSGVRQFIKNGGSIRYKPVTTKQGVGWLVFGIDRNGHQRQVFTAHNGEPKMLKTANALVAYHHSLYPELDVVHVPVIPRKVGSACSD